MILFLKRSMLIKQLKSLTEHWMGALGTPAAFLYFIYGSHKNKTHRSQYLWNECIIGQLTMPIQTVQHIIIILFWSLSNRLQCHCLNIYFRRDFEKVLPLRKRQCDSSLYCRHQGRNNQRRTIGLDLTMFFYLNIFSQVDWIDWFCFMLQIQLNVQLFPRWD